MGGWAADELGPRPAVALKLHLRTCPSPTGVR
ncbi:zf-HC2 domain-containing protein [Rhodococcus sp. IEGM 1408]